MTSTTLSFKSNFFPVFKKTVKQGLLNIIAVPVLAVISSVFAVMITFQTNYTPGTVTGEYDISFGALILVAVMTVICGFSSLSLAPKMFKETYKKQSCDMYFSLPVKRKDYYISAYLLGALLNVVGLALASVIYIAVMYLLSNKYIQFTIEASSFVIVATGILLALLAIYSAFVMCAVTAGRKIHYLLLALICLLCTSSSITGILSNLNTIWGLSVSTMPAISIDPVNNAICSLLFESTADIISVYIISLIEIVGMFTAGLLIFKNRKAEVAEVTITGKVIPYVLLADLGIAAYFYFSDTGIVFSLISGIVCVVLVTMAFSGIFYRKVFTKKTGITAIAICLAGTVFVSSVYFPDYTGYVKNIPEAEEVESIEISNIYNSSVYLSPVLNFISEYSYSSGAIDTLTVTDKDAIADTIALHNKLVDDEVIKESEVFSSNYSLLTMILNDEYYSLYEYADTYDCRITYTLKSGKTLSRTYSVVSNLVADEYAELMKNDEILNQLRAFAASEEDFLYATVDTSDYNYSSYDYDYETDYYDYYDQLLTFDSYENFKSTYMSELKDLNTADFTDLFYTLNDYEGLYYYDYSDDYSDYYYVDQVYLTLYTIDENASDSVKNQLRSLSVSELQKLVDSYDFDSDLYNAVICSSLDIKSTQTKSIDILKDNGIIFPE